MRRTCPPRAGLSRVPTRTSAHPGHLSPAGGSEPCADEDVGAPRVPVPRGRGSAVCRRGRRRTQGTCPPRAGLSRVPTRTSAHPGYLSHAGEASRVPTRTSARPGYLSPAGLSRVPTRTSARPGHLSPAGGGESAAADSGVEFCRLDFGVWLAAHSVPSQRAGYPDGQTQGSAPTFRNAPAWGLPRYIQVTQPRGGCPYNPEGWLRGLVYAASKPGRPLGFRGISGASA